MKEGPSTTGDVEYRVAQSGDATCNGLFSATEGSRTMALKRGTLQFFYLGYPQTFTCTCIIERECV